MKFINTNSSEKYFYGRDASSKQIVLAEAEFDQLSSNEVQGNLNNGEWINMYERHGLLVAEASGAVYDNSKATRDEIDRVEVLAGSVKDKGVVDGCCGMGRHSLEMARRGGIVTGLDFSQTWVEMARKYSEDSPGVLYQQTDMRETGLLTDFCDLVTILGNSFGYFDEGDNVRVLAECKRILKPGGGLVIQMPNKEHVLSTMSPVVGTTVKTTHFGEIGYIRYRRWNIETGRLETIRIHTAKNGELLMRQPLSYPLFKSSQIVELGGKAGFKGVEVDGQTERSNGDNQLLGSMAHTDWYVLRK